MSVWGNTGSFLIYPCLLCNQLIIEPREVTFVSVCLVLPSIQCGHQLIHSLQRDVKQIEFWGLIWS